MPKYLLSSDVAADTDNSILLHKGKCVPVVSEGVYIYHEQRNYYRTRKGRFFVLKQQFKPKGIIDLFLCETFHVRIPKTLSDEYVVELSAQECAIQLIRHEKENLDSIKKIFSFQTA